MTLLSAVGAAGATSADPYLVEQSELSAVDRFSQRHPVDPERYYRDLIPLSAPRPGQQYGFEVDLDACTGCKSCVAACHSQNGLDEGESWRAVTLLSGDRSGRPVQQAVTAACHHCVDPACLNGCPVDAYEKDPITGIVAHLDDQCIGCGYCTLTCPYEVPVFSHRRGIVRKCDMCQGRLAVGEAPACVEACPSGAIRITVVDQHVARADAAKGPVIAGAPPSDITVPTTRYRTARGPLTAPPGLVRPATAHPPLTIMLVLTQLSVGAFIWNLAVPAGAFGAAVAVGAGVIALGASVLHLGRPQYAYRAVIGLRHSWLSREVVAFGLFTAIAALYAASGQLAIGLVAAGFGVAGVACSVLIYARTRRTSWRTSLVAAKFFLTSAVTGAAALLLAGGPGGRMWLAATVAGITVTKVAADTLQFRRLAAPRVVVGAGGVLLPLLVAPRSTVAAAVVLAAAVGGELQERHLFFVAASPPR